MSREVKKHWTECPNMHQNRPKKQPNGNLAENIPEAIYEQYDITNTAFPTKML